MTIRAPARTYLWQAYRRSVTPRPLTHWLALAQPPLWLWWTPTGWGYVAWGAAYQVIAQGPQRYVQVRAAVQSIAWKWATESDEGPDESAPRWFGGFAFAPHETSARGWWSAFGQARFFLPRWLYVQSPTGQAWLTVLTASAERPPWPSLQRIAPGRQRPMPRLLRVEEGLSRQAWHDLMERALRALREGRLSKVVLARTRRLRWENEPAWDAIWQRLNRAYPHTYRFFYQPGPANIAFLGASPELLARVQGERLETMALAGSIGRGRTPAEDAALAARLLTSEKDRTEHAWVVQAIREALASLTADLEIPAHPQVRTYANIQHLYTPITGRLRQARIWEVLQHLHPTPALGGYPRAAALDFIAQHEPVPRGWYAAPLGWVSARGDGEFAGAIRCALLREKEALLYAGAGIVADSNPEREWEEINLKFQAMQQVLTRPEHEAPR